MLNKLTQDSLFYFSSHIWKANNSHFCSSILPSVSCLPVRVVVTPRDRHSVLRMVFLIESIPREIDKEPTRFWWRCQSSQSSDSTVPPQYQWLKLRSQFFFCCVHIIFTRNQISIVHKYKTIEGCIFLCDWRRDGYTVVFRFAYIDDNSTDQRP